MIVVSIHMPEQSGQSNLTLLLRQTSDGALLNTGGDALSESPASSGRFVATVAETWTETLAASVRNAGSLTVRDGWLASGETIVRDAYPSSGGSGGAGDAEQTTLLEVLEKVDAFSVGLAGSSPVEPTGRIANGGRVLAYVGDDFTVRSGTALPIPVKDPAGGLYTLLTSIGVENLQFGASLAGKPAGLITGTIASLSQSGSGASQLCNITVEISDVGVGLKLSEDYEWQIQSTQTHGDETDTLIRLEGMLSLRRNVVG